MERSLALGMLLAAGDRVAVRLGGGRGGAPQAARARPGS